MNNENNLAFASHTILEIEDVDDLTKTRINQKEIKRCSREFNCDSKAIMLFKRERNPCVSDYELISCHFLSDEKLDLHLDKLGIGSRIETKGHSKWLFHRSIETVSGPNGKFQRPGITELYFLENFSQFFAKVVDYDTLAVFDIDGYTPKRRDNLLYKAPLQNEAMVYVSDILDKTKPYYQNLEMPTVELMDNSGIKSQSMTLISHEQSSEIFRGIFETKKPHLIVAIHGANESRTKYLIHLDTLTLEIIGVYQPQVKNTDQRNFFAVFDAEDKEFREQNDIIALTNK
ncbi:hypothetical protein PSE10A_46180 [Pseudomonas amygdali pv. eriobotryae]|uniref:Uncharacterized protein n=1 Tax=Pseudomonas amygdali pv. eriobotryae TaxID=129137 RepID=A0A9P3EEY6_PSEA0|nr:hypothetical protein [Pseudomonas amygdali]GFZ62107.1 hypothetical protein PSE10A_46180 [Pseudomonas amygdali pv. eriobotryae]